jgi:hypothetical protein
VPRPFSQACENNKQPILQVLTVVLSDSSSVLELASGTGQHARFFAEHLSHVSWQPTDLAENLPAVQQWCEDYNGGNLAAPVILDVCDRPWPLEIGDALFTANSLHIMAWSAVQSLFAWLDEHAPTRNLLVIYGPFNYGGKYTSDSNARFDQWLAQQHPDSAIRDFEEVDQLARDAGYRLQGDYAMPANNRILVWQKLSLVSLSA